MNFYKSIFRFQAPFFREFSCLSIPLLFMKCLQQTNASLNFDILICCKMRRVIIKNLVTDRTFGSGSVVRPNLAVRPGSAEPPNHQFLPNHNRTNYNLRFSPIFELLRGYLVQPVTSSPTYRNILLAENATMVLFVREIIPRVINEY